MVRRDASEGKESGKGCKKNFIGLNRCYNDLHSPIDSLLMHNGKHHANRSTEIAPYESITLEIGSLRYFDTARFLGDAVSCAIESIEMKEENKYGSVIR